MKSTCLVLIYFCFVPSLSFAHPVSFEGSTGLMGYHSDFFSHNQVNYSFKYWFAGGVHHLRKPNADKETSASLLTLNFLLKRWNTKKFQANIYGVFGAGESSLTAESKGAGFALMQFDIEDRKLYFLAKHARVISKDQTDFYQTTLRFGVAPYQDEYSGFHSWIILDLQQVKFFGEKVINDITPMLRFFYRNLLFEIGQSFDGVTKFNYITHF